MTLENKAFVAGILIGLGVIINALTSISALGAMLFSFGLLTIIYLALPLYTGKIGFVTKHTKKMTLFLILVSNLAGIFVCVMLYLFANPAIVPILTAAAILKFKKTILQMLIYGIFCGMLIHFAVKCKQSIITIMAITIFILIGAEHCIAAFPFLLLSFSLTNLIKYVMIIIGNSIGAIFIERMLK